MGHGTAQATPVAPPADVPHTGTATDMIGGEKGARMKKIFLLLFVVAIALVVAKQLSSQHE